MYSPSRTPRNRHALRVGAAGLATLCALGVAFQPAAPPPRRPPRRRPWSSSSRRSRRPSRRHHGSAGDHRGAVTTAAGAATTVAAKPGTVNVRDTSLGQVLVDENGMTLYQFDRDAGTKPQSNCYDQCAVAWPPLYVTGNPVAGPGVKQDLLTSSARDRAEGHGRLQRLASLPLAERQEARRRARSGCRRHVARRPGRRHDRQVAALHAEDVSGMLSHTALAPL